VCASHVGTDATGLSVHPVQDIIGMRNIIAHEYAASRFEMVSFYEKSLAG
jgi:hypothetical protein